jgi:DNA-binding beta-propeller fold protein YncE
VLAYQEHLDGASNQVTGLTLVASITQNIHSPSRLAVDTAGHLYVANTGNNTVTVYDISNQSDVAANTISQLTNMTISIGLNRPLGVAVDPGTGDVYVANNAAAFPYFGSVSIYQPSTGGAFTQIGNPLELDGANNAFSAPGAVSIYSAGGKNYVVLALGPSGGTNSVLLYQTPLTASSTPLFDLNNGNGCSSGPIGPTGTALFAGGAPLIYVTSYYSSSVAGYDFQSLAAGGAACPTPFIESQPASEILQPEGVAVDGFGNIFVSNAGNNTITAYSPGAGLAAAPV